MGFRQGFCSAINRHFCKLIPPTPCLNNMQAIRLMNRDVGRSDYCMLLFETNYYFISNIADLFFYCAVSIPVPFDSLTRII